VKVASAIFAGDNGSSPVFILSQDRTLLHSLHDSLMDIKILCEEHGVVCLECFSHEVRMRSNEYMDFTAWKIKKQVLFDAVSFFFLVYRILMVTVLLIRPYILILSRRLEEIRKQLGCARRLMKMDIMSTLARRLEEMEAEMC